MHPKALLRIETHIETALESCLVEDQWPVFESYYNSVSSLSNEVIKHKKEWLTDNNCISIFFDHVNACLKDKFQKSEGVSGKLSELLDAGTMSALKRTILEFIESIPRTYAIYFPLRSLTHSAITDIQLCDSVCIKRFNVGDRLPGGGTGTNNSLLFFNQPQSLSAEPAYVVVQTKGYAGNDLEDTAVRAGLSTFKQILYMCLKLNLVRRMESALARRALAMIADESLSVPTVKATIIDVAIPDKICGRVMLPLSYASHVSSLALNTPSKKITDAAQRGDETIRAVLKSDLNDTSCLIQTDSKSAQYLKSAIEWAFDSEVEDNETVSFIQLCIGLEAVLGEDSGRESLTETLADRCAYLLGNSIENRKRIREKFRELYRLRSNLVHGRSITLKDKEKEFLRWGRLVLTRIILREISNLKSK